MWANNQEGGPDLGFHFGYQHVRWEEVSLGDVHPFLVLGMIRRPSARVLPAVVIRQ